MAASSFYLMLGQVSKEHRPEWNAMVITANERGLTGPIHPPNSKFRDAFLLPTLKLEDLTGPKALLVFLNARSRNPPDTFAFTNYQSASIGLQTKCETSRIRSIYSVREHDSKCNVGDLDVSIRLLILESQDRMLDSIVKSAKGAFHDILAKDLFSDDYPVQEPLSVLSRDSSEMVSIVALAGGGPYQVSHAIDFKALLNLVEVEQGECKDHIWALREDPGYFHETAISRGEHCQESVRDRNGQEHPFKGTRIY
jgi:hypothetical protein